MGHDLRIVAVDLEDVANSTAWLELLDHYPRDPMGGGTGLCEYAKSDLVRELEDLPTFHGALAFIGDEAVGLLNCFAGFAPYVLDPAAGHALFLQKSLPEN